MIILKKLLFKEWIYSFIASLTVLVLLIGVANVVSELLRAVASLKDILLHFVLDLPKWLGHILPLATMMATLFSLNKLRRRNELIAMLSLGMSRFTLISLIGLFSFIIALAQLQMAASLRPYMQTLKRSWLKEGGGQFRQSGMPQSLVNSTSSSGRIWYRGPLYFGSFAAFDKRLMELHNVTLFYYDKSYRITEILSARKAFFVREKRKWMFEDGYLVTSLESRSFQKYSPFKNYERQMTEVPGHFSGLDANIAELPIIPLYEYIERIRKLGIRTSEYEIVLYDKFVMSLACILFALMAVSAIYYPHRRHSSFGKNVLFVFFFTLAFWPLHSFFSVIGSSGYIPPLLASLMVSISCTIYLMFYFYRHRRLSG